MKNQEGSCIMLVYSIPAICPKLNVGTQPPGDRGCVAPRVVSARTAPSLEPSLYPALMGHIV